jgi:hypothetical protein
MIGWLAIAPGTLLLSGNAGAIPGTPGQPITSPGPATTPAGSDPANLPKDVATQDNAGTYTQIPCLNTFSSNNPPDDSETDEVCTDATDRRQSFSTQFGRRLAVGSGILGETDGIRVDYHLNGDLKLQGVAGFPVVSSGDEFNTARRMFGFGIDTGTFVRAWNLNAYLIDEQDNAQLDDRTIGGTLRYQRPKRSLLLSLDYDANQGAMNAITALGAWKLPGRITLSATFDIHNKAIHKRRKKHLQHSRAATDGWNWILPDDRIKHYTSTQRREVTTSGFSLSHAFSQRFKLSGDVAMLDISDNSPLGDATPSETLSNEYFYHLTLTGKDLLISRNSSKLDVRHRVTGPSRISTASIDTRYAINRLWNVSSLLKTEHRNHTTENSAEWAASPAVKMEYKWKEAYGFKVEAGGKWSNQAVSAANTDRFTYFLKLGYKANF